MDNRLRKALEHRGLPPQSDERNAADFYAALPTAEKARLAEELGREASAEPLQRRDAPDLDLMTRSFCVRAATVNEQERSVEAVISTEAPVEVYDWRTGQTLDEVLLIEGAQMPAQMPMLSNHSRYSLDDVLGSIRQLRVQGQDIVGRLVFDRDGNPDGPIDQQGPATRAWNKVRGGHITDVSIGYRITEAVEIAPGQSAAVKGRSYTAGKRTLRIAAAWTPKEGSLVPIGADQGAKIREAHRHLSQPHSTLKEIVMDPKLRAFLATLGLRADASEADAQTFYQNLPAADRARADALGTAAPASPAATIAPPAASPAPAVLPAAGRSEPAAADSAAVLSAERDRVRQVRELAGQDVPAAIRDRAIDDGWDVNRASREFLTAVRGSREPARPQEQPYHATAQTQQFGQPSARALAAGLLIGGGLDPTRHSMHRGYGQPQPGDRLTAQDAEQGHRLQRSSTADIVRQAILADTGRLYWDLDEAFDGLRSGAVSGATLSHVFSTNVYARLLAGWDMVGDTTLGWCDEEDVPNFLTQEDISISGNARLERLPRGDEARHATASDSHEEYKIARYAKQFVVDEQDVIDDRLGALMRMPTELGEGARNLRPDLVYSLMLENPTMDDTGAVFNANAVTAAGGHANLTAAVLSSTSLKAGISAMVKQRLNRSATDPGRQLTIRPRFIIVPADLEWAARELTAAAALAKLFADSNDPYYAQLNLLAQEGLRVVVDDRIGAIGVMDPRTKSARTGTATNWFLAAGGSRGLRVAYRRGTNRQPQMRSFVLDKGRWGLGWDINLDIGAVFTEYRTWHKSTGAA